MAIIPNKNWLMLCHQNTTTNTDDMLQVTQVSETLMTAIRAHLAGPHCLALICISPAQLTWLARKTASKGCAATPASKLSVNVTAPSFIPNLSFNDNTQFVHYFRLDIPSRLVFKDAPTGRYVVIYGSGFTAMNLWVSDFMTEAMILAACGTSAVLVCIVCQKSGVLLLRSTSGTALISDRTCMPQGVNMGVNAPVIGSIPAMVGFVDCFVPEGLAAAQPQAHLFSLHPLTQ